MDPKVLKERHDELLRVNYAWDERYHQLEADFKDYRRGAKQAQDELSDHLFRVKGELAETEEQLRRVKHELKKGCNHSPSEYGKRVDESGDVKELQHRRRQLQQQLDNSQTLIRQQNEEIRQLKETIRSLEKRLSSSDGDQMKRLREENEYLKHQAQTYKEDFKAERADREKLKERLEDVELKKDTDTAKLKLQIDTLRREKEQLKKEKDTYRAQVNLKIVREQALADNYMMGKGYVSRGVSGESNSEPPSLSNSDDYSERRGPDHFTNGDLPPPYLGKGQHKCSKCYRRFEHKKELQDHKIRCLI
jgi:chromosome segregation ATPase